MKCRYCEETMTEIKLCDICKKKLIDECTECHSEIRHGIIPQIPFNVGQNPCGNSEGDDISFDRAVKQYEDGGKH